MENYVNVNFFWGGEVIRQSQDIKYSIDPKKMQYIQKGTTYEEMKNVVYDLMQISPLHWNVKMSYKYPQLGLYNLVAGYYIGHINCDADVTRMLSVPAQMQMGLGDVSMYIEAEQKILDEPYCYEQNWYSQPTQSSYQPEYGSSDIPEYGGSMWSDRFYGGGGTNEPLHGYAGGSSTQVFDSSAGNIGMDYSPPRNTVNRSPCRDLALVDNERHFTDESDADDDDESDADDDDEHVLQVPINATPVTHHHVPRVPWFESEEYIPVAMSYPHENEHVFAPHRMNLSVGSMFPNKQSLQTAIKQFHIATDRSYIVTKSNHNQFIAECVIENCPWRLRAARKISHGLFEITVNKAEHICLVSGPLQDHAKLSSKLIANIAKPHVRDSPHIPVKTIMQMVNTQYNHQVNYWKAWKGKQLAVEEVYGNWATTYEALPMFLTAMVQANPGTVAVIDAVPHDQLINTSVCTRTFWCLKAMIDGWKHARPVLSIDGTFLKGKYRGKLLVAMGVDSNNHQYPLCYALVDEETYENWSWFLILLRKHVCGSRRGVCIISDRAQSIIAAVRDPRSGFCEPLGVHRFCLFHVRSNFSSHHPGNELKELMWKAGTTPQERKFEAYMDQIGQISPAALAYLRNIPAEKWTLCHDTGGARYGQATTNAMEGFNGNIRMARFLPTTAMMEYLFYKAVKIVNTNRNLVEESLQKGEDLCSRSVRMLARIQKKATSHVVCTYSRQKGMFQVRTKEVPTHTGLKGGNLQNVSIFERTCTCGKWATHHLPCSHVVAGCMKNAIDWKQWIEPYHYNLQLQKLWRPLIYPLAPTQYWNYELPRAWQRYGKLIPDEALKKIRKKRGEKGQSVRIRTEMDQTRTGKKCSRCKQQGHTKRSKRCPLLGRE